MFEVLWKWLLPSEVSLFKAEQILECLVPVSCKGLFQFEQSPATFTVRKASESNELWKLFICLLK